MDGSDTWSYFQHNERWQQVAQWEGASTTPQEVFVYGQAGLDGYGGSSYIDDVVLRERDNTSNGSFDTRYYYLQNWRNDVVAIMDYDGTIKEKIVYDAYGRPHAFSPGDIKTAGGADRPDGLLDSNDTWTTGSVLWNKDLGNSSGAAIPDGAVTAADGTTLTNLKAAGYSAGYGILSDSAIGNRKGLAGYEFDPVLNGAASADNKVLYHVRHRVLAADTGKWLQKDPLGYHDSMDLYEYCSGDPIDFSDRYGLCAKCAATCSDRSAAINDQSAATAASNRMPSAYLKVLKAEKIPWCDGIECSQVSVDCSANFPAGTARLDPRVIFDEYNGIVSNGSCAPYDSWTGGQLLDWWLREACKAKKRQYNAGVDSCGGNNSRWGWCKCSGLEFSSVETYTEIRGPQVGPLRIGNSCHITFNFVSTFTLTVTVTEYKGKCASAI